MRTSGAHPVIWGLKQSRTQASIYAPGALPLRKNPGPGWSRASQNGK